jgi:hypothetical protein
MVCLSAYHISRHDKIRGSHLKPQSSGYNVSSDNFKIIKKPMFCDVQSLYFLPDQGLETGLTGVIVGLTGLFVIEIGQTNVQTGLIGSSISDISFLGPQIYDLTIVPLEEDKPNCNICRDMILISYVILAR